MYSASRFKQPLAITLIIVSIIVGSLIFATSGALGQTASLAHSDVTVSYALLDKPSGFTIYRIEVTVPAALINNYASISHNVLSTTDFSKFVTPNAVKPIADKLRQAYPNDEDFANAVLELTQQIPYHETSGSFYAAETLARNSADCDVTSALAASILKAGGLNAVLLDYPQSKHMNVGVSLPQPPKHATMAVKLVQFQGAEYYVGETTSSDWINGWRVGEFPATLETPNVIPITNSINDSLPSAIYADLVSLA
jgi:hypothetical protein